MITATYKTMPALLESLTPFKHGSAHATKEVTRTRMEYRVYSYSTLIAEVVWDGSEGELEKFFNDRKYSMTTSRLQNIIKKAWAI
jgi:hypothetical protein